MTTEANTLEIREQRPDEFGLAVEIGNDALPEDSRITEDQARIYDGLHRPEDPRTELLAFVGGEPAGSGYAGRNVFSPQGRFRLSIRVRPEYRRQGVGKALYRRLVDYASSENASQVTISVHEHYLPITAGWLQREGFSEIERMRPSELRLDSMEPGAAEAAQAALQDKGIALTTLAADDSVESRSKLWALNNLTQRDVPFQAEHEDQSFEVFNDLLSKPESVHDCLVVAQTAEGEFAGFTLLIHQTATQALTGMTGVDPRYRGQGVARAMKLKCAQLARAKGYETMRTYNHVNNPAMLAVNDRLGYVALPQSVLFKKDLV